MPIARRTRRVSQSTLWAAVLAATVAHGAILGTVHALGLSMVSDGFHRQAGGTLVLEEPELKTSCVGDVYFATSGRTAMCLAPWVANVDECLADAQMSLWIDLSSCQARNDPGTAIAMVEQRTVERLPPIDPERLLEEARLEREQQAPPPPPPQIAQAQPPAPPPPPPPPPPQRPQQVIETVKPSDDKEPENARFLSEFNTRVDKQTVARGARNEPMVAKSQPEELAPKTKPKDEPSVAKQEERLPGKNAEAPDVPGNLSMRNPGAQSPAEAEQEAKVRGSTTGAGGATAADGYIPRKGDAAIEQQRRDRNEVARGQSGAGGGTPQLPNLKPTEDVLERALGGGSVDHLEDVENGEETALSSKRWVYASFFNRLKRQVAQNWDPASVWRRRDPTGTVYGFKTRITEVRVSLSRKGELAKILVTTPSGVVELDEEAVRAFKSAGPFPNPPDGLIQKDNLITFGFAFFFEIGSSHIVPKWRMPTSM